MVLVLAVVAFAALLLGQMIDSGSTDMIIAMREADRNRLRADARDALETVLAVLEDFRTVDGALYAPAQGWADPLGYAGYVPRDGVTVQVEFEDESGKLSLPHVDLATLTTLLEGLGLTPGESGRVADALYYWMHPEHVPAESATGPQAYLQAAVPYVAPRRPLRSFGELAAVAVARDVFFEPDGRRSAIGEDFCRQVSLYDFPATNLNAAPEAVLQASGWDAAQVGALLARRGGESSALMAPYLRTMAEADQETGGAGTRSFGTTVSCLWIHVTVRQGAAVLRQSALVTPEGQARLPAPYVVAGQETEAAGSAGAAAPHPVGGAALHYPYRLLQLLETTSLPQRRD